MLLVFPITKILHIKDKKIKGKPLGGAEWDGNGRGVILKSKGKASEN